MDKASIKLVLDRNPTAHMRLVLGLASRPNTTAEVGRESFKDRAEYRKALIEHQRSVQGRQISDFAEELRGLGLVVDAYQLTNTVVVEGIGRKLVEALGDKRVWTADFDEQLTLIEPGKERLL